MILFIGLNPIFITDGFEFISCDKISNISEKKFVNVRDKYEEIKIEKIPFVKKNYKKGD